MKSLPSSTRPVFLLAWLIPVLSQAALVTYLPLDSTAGLTVGKPATGTNDASIVASGAKFGSAALLDGDGDFFLVDTGGGVIGTGERTVSVWVNQVSGTAGLRSPVSFGDNGNGSKFDIDIDNSNDGIEVGAGAGRSATSNVGFTSGAWQFLTISIGSNQTVGNALAYLNGGMGIVSAANTRAVDTSTYRMLIGTSANASFDGDPTIQFFNGLVDDIAVWDEVLTQNEIKGMFDVGNGPFTYTAKSFDLLKQVHDAGRGSVTIGSMDWTYASGLGSTAGLSGGGNNYALVLDATAGTGLISVPEPGSISLLALGTLLLLRRRRS